MRKKETKADTPIIMVEAVPLRTTIRQAVSPFLPPPLVQAMHDTIDPALKPFLGDEASITVVGSLLLAFFVYQILKLLSLSGSRKAIANDDDDDALLEQVMSKQPYQESVVLLGPSLAGKTRLLYWLCHGAKTVQTVVSMRPNVGFKTVETTNKTIRFLDYPGHLPLSSPQLTDALDSRACLVLDSTQPVGPAADILFQLLSLNKPKLQIVIVCHQSDKKGSKNHKRIKIQLRTELETILKVQATCSWWTPGKPLVWEEIARAEILFLSTSCESEDGMEPLESFLWEGTLSSR
jgi:Signal recognition particle receptor beta subunit